MNHSHHDHHHGHHGHSAGGMDDETSIEESTTKKLINATIEMITTTLSSSAMDHNAHSHHNHGTGDSSLSAAAPSSQLPFFHAYQMVNGLVVERS